MGDNFFTLTFLPVVITQGEPVSIFMHILFRLLNLCKTAARPLLNTARKHAAQGGSHVYDERKSLLDTVLK